MKRICALLLSLVLCLSFCGVSCADDREEGAANAVTLVPVMWETATLAQVALPEGYTLDSTVSCCDETTCLGYPLRLAVMASSAEDVAVMLYYCGEQYLQRVSSNSSILQHKEGELDQETMIFMATYMDASDYCDARVLTLQGNASFWKEEDMSFYQSKLDERSQEFYEIIAPGFGNYGVTLDWFDVTAAQKVYTFEDSGSTYCICVMAEVRAYQYSAKGYGINVTNILWDVPGYYVLICPIESYETLHDTVFQTFTENTIVNDQYQELIDQLNFQIRDDVIREWNMQCAASSAYMATMTALTFSVVESTLGGPTYSSSRFSDYMFDQNDYTLSDGSSVKISTSYDYVWQGDNGTVYYSNSLFDEPGGATRLYPNH